MSIIPGIEIAAPDRTDTRSGSAGSPKRFPARSWSRATWSSTSGQSPSGASPVRIVSRHASVVTVKPAGTGIPSAVISARPTPLPPSSSRPPGACSSNAYTSRTARILRTARGSRARYELALVRRVAIIATASGCGKTTFGRELAARLGVPFVELDAIHWQAGWTELDATELLRRVEPIVTGDAWVIDGSYRMKLGDLVLDAADTVVWLDLPRRVWLPRARDEDRASADEPPGAVERQPRVVSQRLPRPGSLSWPTRSAPRPADASATRASSPDTESHASARRARWMRSSARRDVTGTV